MRKIKGSERIYYSNAYKNFFKNKDYILNNATYFSKYINAPLSEIPHLLNTNIYGKPVVNFGSNPTRFRNTSHEKGTRKEFNAYRHQAQWINRLANLTKTIKNAPSKTVKNNALYRLKLNMDFRFNNYFNKKLDKALPSFITDKVKHFARKMPAKIRKDFLNNILKASKMGLSDELMLILDKAEEDYLEEKRKFEEGKTPSKGEYHKRLDNIRKKANKDAKKALENLGKKGATGLAKWLQGFASKTRIIEIGGETFRILKKDVPRFINKSIEIEQLQTQYNTAILRSKGFEDFFKNYHDENIMLSKTTTFKAQYDFDVQQSILTDMRTDLEAMKAAGEAAAAESISLEDLIMMLVVF